MMRRSTKSNNNRRHNLLHHNLYQREIQSEHGQKLSRDCYVWDDLIERLALSKKLEGHQGCVNCISWNDSGTLLASGSDDHCVMIWDHRNRRRIHSIRTTHTNNIFSVQFMPNAGDRLIVSGAGDSKVILHDVNRKKGEERISAYQNHQSRVKRIVTSGMSPHLFWSGSEDGTVREGDIRTSADRVVINLRDNCGPDAEVKSLACNPVFNQYIAVGANDPYVRIFDTRMLSKTALKTLTGYPSKTRHYCPGHLPTKHIEYRRKFRPLATTFLTFDSSGRELLVNLGGEQLYLFDFISSPNFDELSAAFEDAVPDGSRRIRHFGGSVLEQVGREIDRASSDGGNGTNLTGSGSGSGRGGGGSSAVNHASFLAASSLSETAASSASASCSSSTAAATVELPRTHLNNSNHNKPSSSTSSSSSSNSNSNSTTTNTPPSPFSYLYKVNQAATTSDDPTSSSSSSSSKSSSSSSIKPQLIPAPPADASNHNQTVDVNDDDYVVDKSNHPISSDSNKSDCNTNNNNSNNNNNINIDIGGGGNSNTKDNDCDTNTLHPTTTTTTTMPSISASTSTSSSGSSSSSSSLSSYSPSSCSTDPRSPPYNELTTKQAAPNGGGRGVEFLNECSAANDGSSATATATATTGGSHDKANNRQTTFLVPPPCISAGDGSKPPVETLWKHQKPSNHKLTERAEALKLSGNEAFNREEFTKSIHFYSAAIEECPGNPVLYANRSAAYMKRKWDGDTYAALRDCYTTLRMEPHHLKALFRISRCLLQLNRPNHARKCLDRFRRTYPKESETSAFSWLNREIDVALFDADVDRNKMVHKSTSISQHLPGSVKRARTQEEEERAMMSSHELELRRSAVDYKLRFCGHCNTTTDIKEANFWGKNGEYIVGGSDDGSFIIWDRFTCKIVAVLKGDDSIVNCIQPHPTQCLLATSGIESNIKLWEPSPAGKSAESRRVTDIERAASENQLRMNADPFDLMLLNLYSGAMGAGSGMGVGGEAASEDGDPGAAGAAEFIGGDRHVRAAVPRAAHRHIITRASAAGNITPRHHSAAAAMFRAFGFNDDDENEEEEAAEGSISAGVPGDQNSSTASGGARNYFDDNVEGGGEHEGEDVEQQCRLS